MPCSAPAYVNVFFLKYLSVGVVVECGCKYLRILKLVGLRGGFLFFARFAADVDRVFLLVFLSGLVCALGGLFFLVYEPEKAQVTPPLVLNHYVIEVIAGYTHCRSLNEGHVGYVGPELGAYGVEGNDTGGCGEVVCLIANAISYGIVGILAGQNLYNLEIVFKPLGCCARHHWCFPCEECVLWR